MKPRIALIGSRGIPAKYGGFETSVEHLAPRLVEKGYEVLVSCEGTDPPRPTQYKGVKLFYFPLKPFSRVFYETIYDVYSLAKASLLADVIIVLGYGAGFFFFIPKVLRKKVVVNVDGREWQREKYNAIEKTALFLNERTGLLYVDATIADAQAIKAYLESLHAPHPTFIPYGVDVPGDLPWDPLALATAVPETSELTPREYYLIIARLEPENNIISMVDGFLSSGTSKKLVVIGDFADKRYKAQTLAHVVSACGDDKVVFLGAIYDTPLLTMLRQHAFAYLHGHSAGGTNPSLLEAMAARAVIIAHDNPYNREVTAGMALFFSDASELTAQIHRVEANPERYAPLRQEVCERVRAHYSWDDVICQYEALIRRLVFPARTDSPS
ncbi:MAG: DUF1972 domain-containing protein [Halobacteriota archaeon]